MVVIQFNIFSCRFFIISLSVCLSHQPLIPASSYPYTVHPLSDERGTTPWPVCVPRYFLWSDALPTAEVRHSVHPIFFCGDKLMNRHIFKCVIIYWLNLKGWITRVSPLMLIVVVPFVWKNGCQNYFTNKELHNGEPGCKQDNTIIIVIGWEDKSNSLSFPFELKLDKRGSDGYATIDPLLLQMEIVSSTSDIRPIQMEIQSLPPFRPTATLSIVVSSMDSFRIGCHKNLKSAFRQCK